MNGGMNDIENLEVDSIITPGGEDLMFEAKYENSNNYAT